MDAQGAVKARPYVELATGTFQTVVDAENMLGGMYGFRAIPNGYLIDENGVVEYEKLGGFDIRKPETASIVNRWADGEGLAAAQNPKAEAKDGPSAKAIALFQKGLELYNSDSVGEAMALWQQGLALDPDNYIILKQIWAVENPDRFYAGDIDYDWQREQMGKRQ
jgi:hypothetical protein